MQVGPLEFVLSLRKQFPQFGQTSREGHYMQQDAEECWTNLLYSLREKVKVRCARCAAALGAGAEPSATGPPALLQQVAAQHSSRSGPASGCRSPARTGPARLTLIPPHPPQPTPQDPQSPDKSAVKKIFGIDFRTELKSEESGETLQVGGRCRSARSRPCPAEPAWHLLAPPR